MTKTLQKPWHLSKILYCARLILGPIAAKASIFFLCAVGLLNYAHAQQKPTDKVDLLNASARKFLLRPDSMIVYANEALALAKQNKYPYGEGIAYKFKGIYAHGKSNFDEAIQHYNQALNIFAALKDTVELGKANLNIATSYNSKHDYVNSITYGSRALKIFDKLNDNNGRGRVLNLLGIVSSMQKDYRTALRYYFDYNQYAKKARDTIEIASSYNNIGSTYNSMAKRDSAIYFYKEAIPLQAKKDNIRGLGKIYENIGTLYYDKKDYKSALINHQRSMAAYEKVGDRKFLSHSLYHIGLVYKKIGDTTKAVEWMNKSLAIANEVHEQEIIQNANLNLAELQAKTDQYKTAYENLKLSMSANDSILNKDKTAIIEDLRAKYETEKKEQQIKLLAQESTIQKLEIRQRNIYLLIAAALLLVGTIVAYLIYNRRKLAEQARLQFELNKHQELAARAVLNAEERERRRIATDLHDGVGQLLSAALMNLNGLFKKATFNGSEEQLAERSLALVTESYDEMRSISHQMMPNALLKAGLASAVKEFLDKIDESQLKISLETIGLNERLDEQTETVLYRVIQETVNNVIKHAKASKLDIQLTKDNEGIDLTVEDNGKGFDMASLEQKSGIGLKNVLSRVELLKGSVDYSSQPGKGTLVAVHVPVQA